MKNFYLTTTLPYANALPHIGNTLEFVQADVIVRHMRRKLGEEKVWFNVGTDEHGLKLLKKAQEVGQEVKSYVDESAANWVKFCELFGIKYNSFYRTSEPYHVAPVTKFWKAVEAKGYIYTKNYEGLYCVGCEEFKTEKDLVDGKCPFHDKAPIKHKEENYFFALSKMRNKLLAWLEENPEVLKPKKRIEELRNWIKDMEDISISRTKESLPWGIDVPGDSSQVVYVWFDALIDYIAAVGYGRTDMEMDFEKWWPAVQCFGPDNLRFQGGIWQGMLAALDLPQTSRLLCHGMILAADGTKMSKTIGNIVSPFEQVEKYGAEAVRYYLIAGIATYGDSPYKEDDLVNLYNSHLADNFGNLLNRVIHLVNKNDLKFEDSQASPEFKTQVDEIYNNAQKYFDEFELQQAAEQAQLLATLGNSYVTKEEPWAKGKTKEEVTSVLGNLLYLLSTLIDLYQPIIPDSANKAEKALKTFEPIVLFQKIER